MKQIFLTFLIGRFLHALFSGFDKEEIKRLERNNQEREAEIKRLAEINQKQAADIGQLGEYCQDVHQKAECNSSLKSGFGHFQGCI